MEQIEAEQRAAHLALYGPAVGTAQHEFITQRMERISACGDRLKELAGPEEGVRLLCEAMESREEFPRSIPWGNVTLHLTNAQFTTAFFERRSYYFTYCQAEIAARGTLNVEDLLRLVAVQDKQSGAWRLDDYESVAELLGAFLGYISGLLQVK